MDYRLLLPLAVLSVTSLVSFFVERAAIGREITRAAQNDDKIDAALRLLNRDIREVSIGGAGQISIPIIVLTIIDTVPNWVVLTAWFFVFIAIIRLPLVHFSRGRDEDAKQKATRIFLPITPVIALSVPLIVALYAYTIVAVVSVQ